MSDDDLHQIDGEYGHYSIKEERPYQECPHCGEYKCRRVIREEPVKTGRGFIFADIEWQITSEKRHCKNCEWTVVLE